jgi:triacylglycerol lipase
VTAGGESGKTPVLLLPGWNGRAREMHRIERFLLGRGWPARAVRTLEFRDSRGSNVEHAGEIAHAIDRLRELCDAERVDVVAHSMGGLATRWYMAHGAAPTPVRRAIFIGTPHTGTWLAWVARGDGGREMRPRSAFLRTIHDAGIPDHVETYTIRTLLETRVWPARSAVLPGARDFHVRFATHPGLLRNRTVIRRVHDLLAGPVEAAVL